MKTISNSTIISVITKLFVLVLVAKIVALLLYIYLPESTQELKLKIDYKPKYHRIDFKNMLSNENKKKVKKVAEKVHGMTMENMLLKGLYGSKNNAFVIVALKKNPSNTTILSIGEVFQGYTLKTITKNSAIFTKNNKEYILNFGQPNTATDNTSEKGVKKENKVSRKDIKSYAKNTKQLMKDISVKAIKYGQKLKGFKVVKINKKSKIASLGLQEGDLITMINNKELKSYKDVLQIYEQLDSFDYIQLVIIRNNEEMELVYEID
jgi:general secretion pathway protein C